MLTAKKMLQLTVIVIALVTMTFLTAIVTMRVITWGKTVSVPDVGGMELADAINTLKEAGLEITVERKEFHPTVPLGSVIVQDPQQGTSVKKGRNVSVAVSLGSEEKTVPYLSGEVFRRAQILLNQAGLTLGDVARAPSDAQRDKIISQDPPSGTAIQKGGKVDLLVSDGPPPIRFITPDLKGKGMIESEREIRPLGIRLTAEGKGSVVVSQEPKPGFPVSSGSSINVKLGGA